MLQKVLIFFQIIFFITPVLSLKAENFKNWIIEENFKYFKVGLDNNTGFPYDHIFVNKKGELEFGKYSSPTIIGLWAVVLTDVITQKLVLSDFSKEKAEKLLWKLVTALEKVPKWEGLFYWYELKQGVEITENKLISAYDNGNLTIALMTVYGALYDSDDIAQQKIAEKVYKILALQKKGWRKLYDRKKGLLRGGYRSGRPLTNIWIDRFYTESRMAALAAILIADVPQDAWNNLLRDENCPYGEYTLSNGRRVKFLKPYQGAFQAWMPLLFIPEIELSQALKKAHENYADIQIDYALHSELQLLRSASANPDIEDRYVYEPSIGIFNASEDWVRSDVGSPYATALIYPVYPEKVVLLLQETLKKYPQILGPLGLYDAISEKGNFAPVYLALDQLEFILAFFTLANQNYFLKSVEKIKKKQVLEKLYSKIKF